jgi:hypothetical protein
MIIVIDIYSMNFNFLLQATRVLNVGNYDEDELKMIYEFLISLDYEILNEYNDTCTILSYNSDLELYVEIIDTLILVFETREEYEKCEKLKNMKDMSIIIMNNKTI